MTTQTRAFCFTHPNLTGVERIGWYVEALTFAVVVKFNDGVEVKGSLSGVGFQTLYNHAEAARIPWIAICPYCKANPGSHRWTLDGDSIIICRDCAEVEEL
ncbi:MAG: hypothetical protein KJ077_35580 [Anaerolineae bacterium]|nr:hypothetical protein [Anaerolineae bacterium]